MLNCLKHLTVEFNRIVYSQIWTINYVITTIVERIFLLTPWTQRRTKILGELGIMCMRPWTHTNSPRILIFRSNPKNKKIIPQFESNPPRTYKTKSCLVTLSPIAIKSLVRTFIFNTYASKEIYFLSSCFATNFLYCMTLLDYLAGYQSDVAHHKVEFLPTICLIIPLSIVLINQPKKNWSKKVQYILYKLVSQIGEILFRTSKRVELGLLPSRYSSNEGNCKNLRNLCSLITGKIWEIHINKLLFISLRTLLKKGDTFKNELWKSAIEEAMIQS